MNEIKFNEQLEYLRHISMKMKKAFESEVELVNQLNAISEKSKILLYNTYKNTEGKVKNIRKKVSEILISRDIQLSELETIIKEAKAKDPKSFATMYQHWYKMLYMFLFSDDKVRIDEALTYISKSIIESLNANEYLIPKYFDFSGERQTGSTRCWFAFINKTHSSQTTAKQLYLNIDDGMVEYSFYDRPSGGSEDKKTLNKNTPFVFSDLLSVFQKHKSKVFEDVWTLPINYWRIGTTDNDTKTYWNEMVSESKVCIGWPEIGDLGTTNVRNKDDIAKLLEKAGTYQENKNDGTKTRKAGEIFNFYKQIKEGDIILAQNGWKVLGIGRVIGPYRFNEDADFPHEKEVEWLILNLDLRNEEGNLTTVCQIKNEAKISEINKLIKRQPMTQESNLLNYFEAKRPLNQILYGPPGTGKTYHTINNAIAIINPKFDLNQPRESIKEEYDRLAKADQIVFTTFHQSMSYEDFIEGIKPLKPQSDDQFVKYEVQNGFFKKACSLAAFNCYEAVMEAKDDPIEYSFDDLYEAFIGSIQEQLKQQKPPIYQSLRGREVEVKAVNSNHSIIARAKNSVAPSSAPLTKENLQKLYDRFKTIDQIKDLGEVRETVQILPRITEFYAVFKGLKDFEENFEPDQQLILEAKEAGGLNIDEIEKNFEAGVYRQAMLECGEGNKTGSPVVVIIDEINRGNVSQIFGELITLIEEDKRIGKPESLEVMLTYSKKMFGVPPNLYIIGTMNTADRSVEALDTALRRRFSFEEIPPRPELVSPQRKIWEMWWKYPDIEWWEEPYKSVEANLYALLGISKNDQPDTNLWKKMKLEKMREDQIEKFKGVKCTGINLQKLLETINQRIEKLLDRDHQIGHSYFMSVASLDDLKVAFQNKIIPLLQEYFFGDYGKIGLVLGNGFVQKKNGDEDSFPFAKFDDYEDAGDLQTRDVFELIHYAPPSAKTDEDFINAINLLINKN